MPGPSPPVVAIVLLLAGLAGCAGHGGDPPGAALDAAGGSGGTGPESAAATAAAAEGAGGPPPATPFLDTAPTVPDPTEAGALAWERDEFELEARVVDGGGDVSPYVVVPEGSFHFPTAGGPFPVVLLMHGRHGTCEVAGSVERLGAPCPDAAPVVEPVDSYTGYDYLAENLASHGYVVVSLSANHVNDRDNDFALAGDDYGATARARLLLTFLDDLRAVQAGEGPEPLRALAGKLDLSRVGVMGHSRGGEGVARAATLNAEWPQPHSLRAVFALAPTDFDRHLVTGRALGVLLPYCDGDVSNLQGAWMYDDARTRADAGPLHQFLALGANHNWYNTVWTGSDWTNRDDPHCDLDARESGRDEPAAQRAHGLAIMAAFLRAYTGDESAFLPLLTGEAAFEQPGIVTTYQPPVDRRLDVGEAAFDGFADRDDCQGTSCPIERTCSTAEQTYLAWEGPATISFPLAITDASAYERFALRLGYDHASGDAGSLPPIVVVEDAKGRTDSAPLANTFHPPGKDGAKTVLSMAAVDLASFQGVDLSEIVWLRVTLPDAGAAQMADPQFHDLG